jgi:hypothetical protein
MTAIEEKGWPSSCIVWRKKSALVSFHQEEEDDARLILNGALLSTSASIQFGHHSILLLLSYYGGSCWQRIYSLSDSIVGNVHTNPSFLSQIKKAIMTMPGPFWLCVFTTQNNRQEKEKSSFLFYSYKGDYKRNCVAVLSSLITADGAWWIQFRALRFGNVHCYSYTCGACGWASAGAKFSTTSRIWDNSQSRIVSDRQCWQDGGDNRATLSWNTRNQNKIIKTTN